LMYIFHGCGAPSSSTLITPSFSRPSAVSVTV